MSRNKLSILHTESSCGWGGQEIRILTEAEGMVARGHDVTLICPEEAPIYASARDRGLNAIALPIARKNFKGLFAMRRWLKEHSYDVINTHSSTDSWLTALACALIHNSPPIVRTRHISAHIPRNAPTRWLYTRAARHIVVTGKELVTMLVRENGYPEEMITSVTTGIDNKHFVPGDKSEARSKTGLPQDAFIIGVLATLRSWKGHSYLIDAFSKLDIDNARLLIVGGGPQEANLREQIKTLGIEERVIMPGNQEDPVPWLQSMDIFILPSYANEGFPQSIVQAMMCRLPVIATPIGSTEESVIHGKTGIIIPPRDGVAIIAAIHNLYKDEKLREKLAGASYARANQEFNIEVMLEKMEGIFCRVATK